MRYRKKPVEIEAHQWDGQWPSLHTWLDVFGQEGQGDGNDAMWQDASGQLVIPTLEGDMRADVGDWIIRGIKGEFYPCKPDVFEATYDQVG